MNRVTSTLATLLPGLLLVACGTERPDAAPEMIGTSEAAVTLPMSCSVGLYSQGGNGSCHGYIDAFDGSGEITALFDDRDTTVPKARRRYVWLINGAPVSNANPDIYIPGSQAPIFTFETDRCDMNSTGCVIYARRNCFGEREIAERYFKFEIFVFDKNGSSTQPVDSGTITAALDPVTCPTITAGGPDTGGGNGGQEDINPCPGGFRDEYFECPGDPLVVDFGNRGFDFTPVDGGVLFDMDGDGSLERTAWTDPGADDAFLVFDRNGNGIIDNGRELFGDSTLRPNGRTARLGYEALRDLDRRSSGGNQNFALDPGDEAYWRLQLWTDRNHNGFSEPNELESLAQRGVDWISVLYLPSQREDENGNHLAYNSLAQVRSGRSHRLIKTTDVFFRIGKGE